MAARVRETTGQYGSEAFFMSFLLGSRGLDRVEVGRRRLVAASVVIETMDGRSAVGSDLELQLIPLDPGRQSAHVLRGVEVDGSLRMDVAVPRQHLQGLRKRAKCV